MKRRMKRLKTHIVFLVLDDVLPEPNKLYAAVQELIQHKFKVGIITRLASQCMIDKLRGIGMDGLFDLVLGSVNSVSNMLRRYCISAQCDAGEVICVCWNEADLTTARLTKVITILMGSHIGMGSEPDYVLFNLEHLSASVIAHSKRAR